MTNTEIIKQWFTNKNEYLIWRTAWKENYAALAKEIRLNKAARKGEDAATRSICQWRCCLLRREAAALLEQRKQSKIEAQRQYLASQPKPTETTCVAT